jgi:hypothetical protein
MKDNAKANMTQQTRVQAQNWDRELADTTICPPHLWEEPGFRAGQYAKTGLLLGSLAGCTSLLANVIGSVLWPAISGQAQHPLRIIQVYLTFPLGESALALDSGVVLSLGCLLYLATGMLYGLLFELAMSRFIPNACWRARFVACSMLALAVWAVNFYGLLSWLQPLVLGGHWIIELIPWWVGALTHLVFGWTMALLYPMAAALMKAFPVSAAAATGPYR